MPRSKDTRRRFFIKNNGPAVLDRELDVNAQWTMEDLTNRNRLTKSDTKRTI